jgi:hypothetical protein
MVIDGELPDDEPLGILIRDFLEFGLTAEGAEMGRFHSDLVEFL